MNPDNTLDIVSIEDAILSLAGIVAVLAGIWLLAKFVHPIMRGFFQVIDEILGKPEKNGLPAKPSLVSRVAALEKDIAVIKKHVVPNHGSTNLLSEDIQELNHMMKEMMKHGFGRGTESDSDED